MTNLSRRSALLGGLTSTVALAAPALGAVNKPKANVLADVIEAHRQHDQLIEACYEEMDAADQRFRATGIDKFPKVQIGNLIVAGAGEPTRPIYATTHEEIAASFEQRAATFRQWSETSPHYAKTLANLTARYNGFHAELDRLTSLKDDALEQSGFTAAQARLRALHDEELRLGACIVMARPANLDEAAVKRAYITEHLFEDWGGLIDAVLSASVEV